jgi:hypothetical protein
VIQPVAVAEIPQAPGDASDGDWQLMAAFPGITRTDIPVRVVTDRSQNDFTSGNVMTHGGNQVAVTVTDGKFFLWNREDADNEGWLIW